MVNAAAAGFPHTNDSQGALSTWVYDGRLGSRAAALLGLRSDVERTSIEGMGCLTGFRLLNLARQVAAASPHARILVIAADLRSALGNALPEKASREDIVSVAVRFVREDRMDPWPSALGISPLSSPQPSAGPHPQLFRDGASATVVGGADGLLSSETACYEVCDTLEPRHA